MQNDSTRPHEAVGEYVKGDGDVRLQAQGMGSKGVYDHVTHLEEFRRGVCYLVATLLSVLCPSTKDTVDVCVGEGGAGYSG